MQKEDLFQFSLVVLSYPQMTFFLHFLYIFYTFLHFFTFFDILLIFFINILLKSFLIFKKNFFLQFFYIFFVFFVLTSFLTFNLLTLRLSFNSGKNRFFFCSYEIRCDWGHPQEMASEFVLWKETHIGLAVEII